ncbi:O-antigen ligase family protein [Gimesia panareensis]|uniref:O-Antigen ligase n=1 Tax=Gimesia panareensis TaxID=2527978 RepID=A0A517Q2Y0_9PLAN|nr:O-antigen ligase family protein [Gimesia panareensis]QDT25987.1 O-Antigen ligase [Gimesia panareensis]QDU48924.1 O-Antigen ligase [Gimesia panareensis]
MSKRRKQNRSQPPASSTPPMDSGPISLGTFCDAKLLFLTGLLVSARYFLPAESAAQGETLPLVLGWFLAAILFFVTQLTNCSRSLRLDRFDAGVWLLVLGQVLATLVMILFHEGQQRAALNMLWEWVALGFSFSLLRRVVAVPTLRITFLQCLLATIVLLSLYGIWQHHWMYRQLAQEYLSVRQQYDAAVTPDASVKFQNELISMGVPAHALQGSSRQLWEDRLLKSNEPLGMFALANTFAGLLAVGFLISFAMSIHSLFPPQTAEGAPALRSRFQIGVYLLCTMLIGYCLILTKSRSAWGGLLAGLVSLGLLKLLQRRQLSQTAHQFSRKQLITGVSLAVILLLGFFLLATLSGGFDRAVLSEAPKSLQYRIEYWTATWDVIKENLMWGTGPGNFREHYLKYKLPGSSEEIADPHNLFLDVWANAGLIALLGLLLTLALAGYRWFLKPLIEKQSDTVEVVSVSETDPLLRLALVLGFTLTFPLLWFMQLFLSGIDETLFWLFLIGWLAVYFTIRGGRQTADSSAQAFSTASLVPLSLAAGFVALSVHLLIAGGIAMPAITQTWLLLMALAFPVPRVQAVAAPESAEQTSGLTPIHLRAIPLLICVLLLILFVMTDFAPTIQRDSLVQKAELALMRGQSARIAQQRFSQAGQADPLSPEPWQALAELKFREGERDRRAFEEGVQFKKSAIQRNPLNPLNYFDLGRRYYEQFKSSQQQEDLTDAIDNLKRAVSGYPHNARFRALLAEALSSAGQISESRQQAEQALELDQANRSAQHVDKYLQDETVSRMKQIINNRQTNQN